MKWDVANIRLNFFIKSPNGRISIARIRIAREECQQDFIIPLPQINASLTSIWNDNVNSSGQSENVLGFDATTANRITSNQTRSLEPVSEVAADDFRGGINHCL